ncbi:hypothetical protein EDF46_0125 [Frondihabitans sp. PhB188]|nr:hypothetical protein EDF46_0125 [Frondihabitans sp. PhB188]
MARRRSTAGRGNRRRAGLTPRPTERLLGFALAIGSGLVVTLAVAIGISAVASGVGTRIGDAANAVAKAASGGAGGQSGTTAGGADAGSAGVSCPAVKAVQVGSVRVPAGPIAGYCQDRLINAAHIINAARAQGIGTRTQAIGVMTAMGESSLVNIDHGDAVGPDSRGLFQQRDNGAWGTYSDRMTPYIAATHFFDKLVRLPSWKTLAPTEAAHEVQVNADANHYASYWPAAVAVVEALSGPVPQ